MVEDPWIRRDRIRKKQRHNLYILFWISFVIWTGLLVWEATS